MEKQVFINLPVKDVNRSMTFYHALGFILNPDFSDEQGKCMKWGENIFLMLLSPAKFSSFSNKPIADTKSFIAGLYSLPMESIEHMNETISSGLQAGGSEPSEMKDNGFMQQRTLEDYDGHTWELFFMDASKM